ncbi:MAG: Gfo/Idh/MocA family oxidoreductase [Eubacterium sp.]|nr:Gfo/Idh/MocA family oxidoreductase [Eubacterium sp.]
MITFKVGILGAGAIAARIADCLNELSGFTPYAIASRDEAKAAAFAVTHQIEKSYGSYDELIADPKVELVYIATVTSTHAELAKRCLEAGKPCLVEKPFSFNSATTREVLELAKEKDLFCGEALWTRYMPLTHTVVKLANESLLGPVRHVTAAIGYDLHEVERLTSPELAGGALLDIGIYPLSFVVSIMGQLPANFAPSIIKWKTNVDAIDAIQLNFAKARSASVFATMTYNTENKATIYCTGGRIEVDNVNCPEKVTVYGTNGQPVQILQKPEKQKSGYEFEFMAAREAVMTGKIETPEHTHQDIIHLSSFLETIRRSAGIVFPLPGEPSIEELSKQFKKV